MRITPHSYQVTPSVSVNISIAVIKICSRFSSVVPTVNLYLQSRPEEVNDREEIVKDVKEKTTVLGES
ncbi:hypothetical protein ATANTOWER_031799 [Ataeniobius toweri]|uniref:Uncharacterized protein n=1 Tax=Ataeniobius toweri TaxID=208326 RepID=A0ABU7AC22_9TELE|nr:hypothetical protein [Ataeniobius toweri]